MLSDRIRDSFSVPSNMDRPTSPLLNSQINCAYKIEKGRSYSARSVGVGAYSLPYARSSKSW